MGYNADCSNLMITWSQFCKEPLPDRSFTFWEWFYAVMKLTKEDLRGMWIDGWVDNMWSESKMSWDSSWFFIFRALLGFVSRQEAEDFLKSSDVGTFLIRFSDSELGGVTVAWSSCKMQRRWPTEDILFVFSKWDNPGERGGDAPAFHEEGSHDPESPGQNPRLSSDDQSLPKHP